MKKLIFVATFFLFLSTSSNALHYFTGVGVRFGKFNSGISLKHFFNEDNSTGLQLEGYYTKIASGGFSVKGFLVNQVPFHVPIIQIPLDLILGGGAHVSYFPMPTDGLPGYYYIDKGDPIYYGKNVVAIGVDATIQLEYKIPYKIAPISITIDCVPFYEFVNRGPEFIDFGVSIRYVFR